MRMPSHYHERAPDVFHHGREVTHIDMWQIDELLKEGLRNPHACITKSQLKRLAEQLLVRNVLLEKQVTELLEERGHGQPAK